MKTPDLNSAIVRILKNDQEPRQLIGAGFLVSDKHVLTCAHVVADAIGIPRNTIQMPLQSVFADFPLIPQKPKITAKIIAWYPLKENPSIDECEDIAVLELTTPLPNNAQPVPLLMIEAQLQNDRKVKLFGFPKSKDEGYPLEGELKGLIGTGKIHINTEIDRGTVAPGFSGSAVWDKSENAVVGMVASIDEYKGNIPAYMIPASMLVKAFPELNQQSRPPNPYRGLEAFREEHAPFYFGRDAVIGNLRKAVEKNPLVAVIGASGSGKSSLVFAGLVPKLRQSGQWLITDFRPKNQPFVNLALSLIHLLYQDKLQQAEKLTEFTEKLNSGAIGLPQIIRLILQENHDKRLLLIADQFEELYTLNSDRDLQQRFADRLLIAMSESSFSLLLTMRADFMSQAIDYRPFAEALNTYHTEFLAPMSKAELRKTIEKPAENCGVKLESGLTDLILRDLGNEPGNLPLLEFALTQLWEKQTFRQMTHQAYSEIGGVTQALAIYADKVYAEFNAEEQNQVRRIFIQLVHPGQGTEDTRQVAPLEQFKEHRNLIVKLADKRLVVTGQHEETKLETVEVVHEALIRHWQPLKQWMNEEREFRVWQERIRTALRQWKSFKDDYGALLRGAILAEAEEWQNKRQTELNDQEKEYIKRSREYLRTEEERWKILYVKSEENRKIAEIRTIEALNHASHALFISHDELGALITGVKAGKGIKYTENIPKELKNHVISNLREVVYGVWEKNRLEKHESAVNNINFSSNDKILVSASDDNSIRVWDIESGSELSILKGHSNRVNYVDISPDGKILASASKDETIRLWNLQNYKEISVLKGHSAEIRSVSFDQFCEILVSGSYDNTIKFWSLINGKEIKTFKLDSNIYSIKFSLDNTIFASASADKIIRLLIRNSNEIKILKGHSGIILCLDFNNDSTVLASGSGDNTIKLWSLKDFREIKTLKGHIGEVKSIHFCPINNKLLISGSYDGTIKLWDIEEGKEIKTLRGHSGAVNSIKFNQNGNMFASGSFDNTIKLWNIKNDNMLKGHSDCINSLSFDPNGVVLASNSSDGSIKIWNIKDSREIKILKGYSNSASGIKFCSNGNLLISGGWDSEIKILNLRENREINVFKAHQYNPIFNFDIHDRYIVVQLLTNEIKIFNINNGCDFKTLEGNHPCFSPDGRYLAIGNSNNTIKLLDAETFNEIKQLKGHSQTINAIAFNSVFKIMASGSNENEIKLWNIETGDEIRKFIGHSKPITALDFSPDGKILASASADRSIKLWNVENGSKLNTLKEPNINIKCLSFSPDGKLLAWGGSDGKIRLRDVKELCNSDLDDLLLRACEWINPYLKHNPNVSEEDRRLCDDILMVNKEK